MHSTFQCSTATKSQTPAVLHREDPGAVGAPHDVGGLGDDLPLVEVGMAAPPPIGREQVVLPHEPQHPAAAHLDAVPHPEAGPDLAVPLTLKRRGVQVRPDQLQEFGVSEDGLRPPFAGRGQVKIRPRAATGSVVRRTGLLPGPADQLHAVRSGGGAGGRAAHFFDLPRAKGPGRLTRAHSNSFSMVNSPRRFMALSNSALRGSPLRALRASSMPASAASRHFSSR